MSPIIKRIALIVGSSRAGGNGPGLANWLSPIVQSRLDRATSANFNPSTKPFEVIIVDPTAPPHPLGPVVDGSRMPSQIHNSAEYASESIRSWSAFVASCSGFVFLTPEYNGGYPGELKNAIDHIFWEWKDKAALVVSYGGGGGARSSAQLQVVLNSVKLKLTNTNVQIKLPKQFSGGADRVPLEGADFPEFLAQYVQPVEAATDELVQLLSK